MGDEGAAEGQEANNEFGKSEGGEGVSAWGEEGVPSPGAAPRPEINRSRLLLGESPAGVASGMTICLLRECRSLLAEPLEGRDDACLRTATT